MLYSVFIYTICGQCSNVKLGYDNLVCVKFNVSETPGMPVSVGCCHLIAVEMEARNV